MVDEPIKNHIHQRKDRCMQNRDSTQSDKDLRNVIKINEAQIQVHLGQMVRSTVEEVLMENT
jgi:hypothetical protein